MKQLLPPDYRPLEKEPFMNPMQLEYFRQKLLRWRAELLQESNGTLQHLQEESLSEPDIADRASLETDRALELRTRDRERKSGQGDRRCGADDDHERDRALALVEQDDRERDPRDDADLEQERGLLRLALEDRHAVRRRKTVRA